MLTLKAHTVFSRKYRPPMNHHSSLRGESSIYTFVAARHLITLADVGHHYTGAFSSISFLDFNRAPSMLEPLSSQETDAIIAAYVVVHEGLNDAEALRGHSGTLF